MKLSTVLPLAIVSLLGSDSKALEVECREKTAVGKCESRVKVLITDLVYGLKDDVPVEVYETFVTASSKCFNCVEETDVVALSETVDESHLSENGCKWSGCWCCEQSWCQPATEAFGITFCPEQCYTYDDFAVCDDDTSRRRLTAEENEPPHFINYELDVCMDDITPLDASTTNYVDHTQMLADLESQLHTCYEDKDGFLDSWSSLCADSGIDLSLMARREGDLHTVMFGATGLDSENAVVTTYSSDESHRSTSHMIFYSALGFVAVSAFAVVGTAVVVKVLNKRKEVGEKQAAQWVSEMANVDTANPLTSA